jgi:hypothetical protein
MGPIDYSSGLQPVSPFKASMQGFAAGDALRQQQMAQQAAQAQAMQENQLQQELAALSSKPGGATSVEYAQLMTRYPQLSEKLKTPMEAMNKAQQESALSYSSQVLSALTRGQGEVAASLLEQRAEGMANAGNTAGAEKARAMANQARTAPNELLPIFSGVVLALPGGDKVLEGLSKMGAESRAVELHVPAIDKAKGDARQSLAKATTDEANAEVAKPMAEAALTGAQADATTKGVQAKYAEKTALLDLEKKGWDISKIKADISYQREANRIAAMNAQANREGNALKLEELKLKINEAQGKQDALIRERVDKAESGASAIDNMLNTIQRLKKNPALRDVIGSLEGSDLYPTTMAGMISAPGFTSSADARNDAISLIETIKSQTFMAQLPQITGKGLGALSNEEGKKIEGSFQNMHRKQSEASFMASLNEAERLLLKGRANLSKVTGVPLGKPDTPQNPGAKPDINSFFK